MKKAFQATAIALVAVGALMSGAGLSNAAPQDADHPAPALVASGIAPNPAPLAVLNCSPWRNPCATGENS